MLCVLGCSVLINSLEVVKQLLMALERLLLYVPPRSAPGQVWVNSMPINLETKLSSGSLKNNNTIT